MAKRTTEMTRATEAVAAAPEKSASQQAIVDNDTLRRLYEIVLTCRTAADGTEAAAAGATAQAAATIELTGDDAIACSTDSAAVNMVREHSPRNSPAKLIERTGAGTSQLSVAAGVALGKKIEGSHGVVVALTDAASMSAGAAYDALNYASANKLPMILVVQNMGPTTAAPAPEFTTIAQAHGVPGFVVDGDDAVAVYRVAREAINRARLGRGPSLIECRAFESTEAPLRHLERYLEKHGLWTPAWKRQLQAKIQSVAGEQGAA